MWLPTDTLSKLGPLYPASQSGHGRHASTVCKDSGQDLGGGRSTSAMDQSWQLQPVSSPHGIFVTHNGDFESFELFGQKKSCTEMMTWLSAVLHVPSPASCDSVAIAGESKHVTAGTGMLVYIRMAHMCCVHSRHATACWYLYGSIAQSWRHQCTCAHRR